MLGRLSMKEDLSALTNRIYQLEIDIIDLTNEINETNQTNEQTKNKVN
jgi:hypothetical protein